MKKYLLIITGSFVNSTRIEHQFVIANSERELKGYAIEHRRDVADSMDHFEFEIVELPENTGDIEFVNITKENEKEIKKPFWRR